MGATGSRGIDGNTIHTVAGTPGNELGKDGDYAIDNANWRIYGPRSGGTWGKAKDMLPGPLNSDFKGTIINMGGGGGGGGNGAAVERPPIIDDGSNTPPTIYPPSPGQPGSNLQQGDMWIDANGALHFYYGGQWNKVTVYTNKVLPAEDAPYLGRIVTPNGEIFLTQQEYNDWLYTRTDRRPIVSAAAPSIHPDFPAYPLRVGDYWIDANNRLYFWNGSGWAPIEGGGGRNPIFDTNEPIEHPDYLPPDNALEIGDIWYDIDDNFKQYIWNGAQWVVIAADRVEAFTRFYEAVDPSSYNSGNDGTCALTATGSTIETITNVKVAGTDGKSKVRYLYKVNEDIVIEDERNGAYAVLRVVTVNGAGDYDVELEHYNGIGSIDFGAQYAFGSATDRGVIPDVGDDTHQPGTLDDRYVNRVGGDDMEGPLEVTGTRATSVVEVLNVDSGEASDLQLKRNGTIGLYIADGKNTTVGDLKFNTDAAKIIGSSNVPLAQINTGGIFYDGGMTVERHLVNKGYVDEQIDEVVGLLGGIGTSNKAGVFTWQASGAISPGGWQFEGRTSPDYQYIGLNQINISKVDKAGNTWSVDDFPVNEVLRIEDESDGHFLEGHITAVVDGGPASIQVTYTIDEANGTADGDQVISVGQNLDHKYVERTGDSMVGDLEMQNSKIDFTNMGSNRTAIQARRAAGEDLTLLNLTNTATSPASSNFYNIKIQGNTFYNGMQIMGGSNAASVFWQIRGGSGEMKFFSSTSYEHNRLSKVGAAVDDDDAVTYGQVKQELQDFRDDLVQELSFGTWSYSSNNITPITSKFYVRGSNGVTSNVSAQIVDTLIFNVQDLYGNTAPFDRVDVGELFTLTRAGIVLKYRVTAAPTVSGSQGDGRVVAVNYVSQNQSATFGEGQVWSVQLTEFKDISVDELDDTYLRLDTSNDPLENTLRIHSTDFGEAKLVLRGKRDNANNTCATVEFNNELETDGNKIGYLTYYNKDSTQLFRFNHDVSFDGNAIKAVAQLQIYNEGSIDAGNTPRIILRNPSQGGDGGDYGAVSIRRAINWRRSFTIRGNVDGAEDDIFYANTTADGTDGIIYKGHTGFEYNIVNRKALTEALENFEVGSALEHTPFIANLSSQVRAANKPIPDSKEVVGFYSSSGAAGDYNQFVGNWNSYIGCGLGVVSTQSGTNNYADLPADYDEEWLGTVTILDKTSGGMKYKNTLYRVQRVGDVIRLWVRPTGSTQGKKPMFGVGTYSDLTDIFVVVEGYRIAST